MTRQIHDQFAKEYLEELLTPLGTIRKSKKVKSEVQEIDVWFEPFSSPTPTELPLGLLGKMAATSCLFEPFRNPPTEVEIRSSKSLKAGIIVIHQLPVIDDTLWLRVLGKGGTQKRAVEELVELPERNPFRENLLEILANWRKNLELRDNLSTEEQEDIMNLSPAYLQQREEWKQEGIQQGSLEERYSLIASLLEGRFGSLDSELSGLVERIAQLPISERTGLLLSLANLSREELLQRFREN
ncbi:MAG: hypothetical protein PX638_11425 [Microcystis sp. M53599_WE4]|nr:hypothetical protein [Microcystis sp. M53599_WE4]